LGQNLLSAKFLGTDFIAVLLGVTGKDPHGYAVSGALRLDCTAINPVQNRQTNPLDSKVLIGVKPLPNIVSHLAPPVE
jgi:hypothetical protein